jgi:glucose/arabinose dehydrogenase
MPYSGAVRSLITLIFLLLLGSCGGGGSPPPVGFVPPPPPPPPPGGLDTDVQRVFTQISFASPVALMQAPGDNSRWFAVEQLGIVRVFDNNQNVVQGDVNVFVDIRGRVTFGGERGLLGMAFHPNFAANGQVFLSYTGGAVLTSIVSRFTIDAVTGYLDPASETLILDVPQENTNHNGGNIAFGPDGYLYIGFGDGGGGGDPFERAQNTNYILGSMVRLDVDGGFPYAIPMSNPFSGNTNCVDGRGTMPCPEIYAWGLRNPWRWSFDRQTGELWVADVGQGTWEEVNRVEPGMNYGWDEREGAHCYEPPAGCSLNNVDPITEYDHSVGQSITGGFVYRGTANPGLQGYYVFGDYVSGRIWAVLATSPQGTAATLIDDTALNISSFAEGVDGELYAVDHGGGGIYRIVDAP